MSQRYANGEIVKLDPRQMMSAEKRYRGLFENANEVFIGVLDEFPFHQVQQPGKGLLLNFFMLEAIGADHEEKQKVYLQLQAAFRALLQHNLGHAEEIMRTPPPSDPAISEAERQQHEERAKEAHAVLKIIEVMASIMPKCDSDGYEPLAQTMRPYMTKLRRKPAHAETNAAPEPLVPAA